ncbi:MAG TPA: ABC transporter permease [Acholeplasma sp.]|jgi:sodium transport system permease protein|nr:ABC transporter permease [Acholeplasma sp.]
MKKTWAIAKKDLDKVLKFPGTLFTTILLPGLIFFLVYTTISVIINRQIDKEQEKEKIVYVYDAPAGFEEFQVSGSQNKVLDSTVKFVYSDYEYTRPELEAKMKEDEHYIMIVFDQGFYEKATAVTNETAPEDLPNVKILYNNQNEFLTPTAQSLYYFIAAYKNFLVNQELGSVGKTTEIFTYQMESILDEVSQNIMVLAMMLPMMLMIIIFSGTLGIGVDAIAGEKERGTLASLLMMPVRREQIIIGKTLSTSILSLLVAASSFIGMLASTLVGGENMFGIDLTAELGYGFGDYMMLLLILIVIAFTVSILVLICSTLGKNPQQASGYAMPLYIVCIMLGVASSTTDLGLGFGKYFVPIFNLNVLLSDLISFKLTVGGVLATVGSSIVFIGIIVMLLVRAFRSERIIFDK